MKYPIHERFATFQGEGVHMGRSAFFVRTFGCPVQCPWCDSAGTWHPDWVPPEVEKMTAEAIVEEALDSDASIVVVTGGEPTVYDLAYLTSNLLNAGLPVHLETSGGFPIRGTFNWVTLSPKKWKPPLALNVQTADEFKVIVESPEDIAFYFKMLRELGYQSNRPIWLHPEWSHREDPVVLGAIADTAKQGKIFRAGWQLHKLYRVDCRDMRTKPMVPLGGDLRKGY